MKILLDECVTKKLKKHLGGHQVYTVFEMGWSGLKNGKLLSKCVENEFDVLLTIDKNISSQQSLDKYPIALVIFDTGSSKIDSLMKFVAPFESHIPTLKKNKATLIVLNK